MNNEINKQGARELSKILQAFAEGKTIQQWQSNDEGENFWVDVSDDWHLPIDVDSFCNEWTGYRIKPESNYRPFKNADECCVEMLKHQPFGWLKSKYDGSLFFVDSIEKYKGSHGSSSFLFEEPFLQATFADGTPFGIKEGDEQ